MAVGRYKVEYIQHLAPAACPAELTYAARAPSAAAHFSPLRKAQATSTAPVGLVCV